MQEAETNFFIQNVLPNQSTEMENHRKWNIQVAFSAENTTNVDMFREQQFLWHVVFYFYNASLFCGKWKAQKIGASIFSMVSVSIVWCSGTFSPAKCLSNSYSLKRPTENDSLPLGSKPALCQNYEKRFNLRLWKPWKMLTGNSEKSLSHGNYIHFLWKMFRPQKMTTKEFPFCNFPISNLWCSKSFPTIKNAFLYHRQKPLLT